MSKTNADEARELAKNSSYFSFLLTYLIRQNDGRSDEDGRRILELILDIYYSSPNPTLEASKVFWYGSTVDDTYIFNPVTGKLDGNIRNRSVCFSESTLK